MPRVLLVDDDIAEISAVKRVLTRAGHQALLATNAEDALGAIGRSPPAALVVAATCDGGEALRRLAEDGFASTLPLLVLGESAEAPARAEQLARPVDPSLLAERLAAALGVAPPAPPQLAPVHPVARVPLDRRAAADALRARAEELRRGAVTSAFPAQRAATEAPAAEAPRDAGAATPPDEATGDSSGGDALGLGLGLGLGLELESPEQGSARAGEEPPAPAPQDLGDEPAHPAAAVSFGDEAAPAETPVSFADEAAPAETPVSFADEATHGETPVSFEGEATHAETPVSFEGEATHPENPVSFEGEATHAETPVSFGQEPEAGGLAMGFADEPGPAPETPVSFGEEPAPAADAGGLDLEHPYGLAGDGELDARAADAHAAADAALAELQAPTRGPDRAALDLEQDPGLEALLRRAEQAESRARAQEAARRAAQEAQARAAAEEEARRAEEARRRADEEARRAAVAEERALSERQARETADRELARLRRELEEARVAAEERARAVAQASRAEEEEARRRAQAEAEEEQLRAAIQSARAEMEALRTRSGAEEEQLRAAIQSARAEMEALRRRSEDEARRRAEAEAQAARVAKAAEDARAALEAKRAAAEADAIRRAAEAEQRARDAEARAAELQRAAEREAAEREAAERAAAEAQRAAEREAAEREVAQRAAAEAQRAAEREAAEREVAQRVAAEAQRAAEREAAEREVAQRAAAEAQRAAAEAQHAAEREAAERAAADGRRAAQRTEGARLAVDRQPPEAPRLAGLVEAERAAVARTGADRAARRDEVPRAFAEPVDAGTAEDEAERAAELAAATLPPLELPVYHPPAADPEPDPAQVSARRRVAALRERAPAPPPPVEPMPPAAPSAPTSAPPAAPSPEPARAPVRPPPAELRAGNLGDLPAPRLLAVAARARLDGRLDFEGAAARSLFFEGGRVVGATSAAPAERVEEVALRLGLVTRDQHRIVAGSAAPLATRRAALLLLERGFLKPSELAPLVRRRTEEVVFGIFGEGGARFRWSSAEVPPDESTSLERSTLQLAVEGVRRRWLAPELDLVLGGNATLLAPIPTGPSAADLALSAEDRRILALADGLRTLDEVVATSPLDALSTRQLLAALVLVGALAVRTFQAGRPAAAASAAIDLARVRDKLEQVRRADYFTVLGVGRLCTPHEVRDAHDRLRAEFDPRRFQGIREEGLEGRLEEILRVVGDARDVLADDFLRAEYLRGLGE